MKLVTRLGKKVFLPDWQGNLPYFWLGDGTHITIEQLKAAEAAFTKKKAQEAYEASWNGRDYDSLPPTWWEVEKVSRGHLHVYVGGFHMMGSLYRLTLIKESLYECVRIF